MEDANKLPLKRVELSLTKFNEVAIPHHLELLRQHKANIIKYESVGEWERVRREQVHARRVVAQLRGLLAELRALRDRVVATEVQQFDVATHAARELTLRAIADYLEAPTSPPPVARSTDSVGVLTDDAPPPPPPPLDQEVMEVELASREAALRGCAELQHELGALHRLWEQLHQLAVSQQEQVSAAGASVQTAGEGVEAARAQLGAAHRLSSRLRLGTFGLVGAALGAAAGGPLGLMVGGKLALGGLAALAGGALGAAGGLRLHAHTHAQEHDKRH